jgi:hypothetical protein
MRRPHPELYADVIAQIKSLETLKPRWNAHGASAIAESARDAAITFLRQIEAKFGSSVLEPAVAPTSDGGVSLEWKFPPQLLEIVLLPHERNEYSLRDLESDKLIRADEDLSSGELIELIRTSVSKYHRLA